MPNILDSDSDASDREDEKLVINKKYAVRFEAAERKKELARAKDLLLDEGDDSSDSESEDEDAELLSPGLDVQIVKTINSIRKKDPKIYDKEAKWFAKKNSENENDEEDSEDESTEKTSKKQRFKDVLRNQLLSDGADIDEVGDNDDKGGITRSSKALAYDAEQEKIRRALISAVKGHESGDDDDGDDSDDEMLKVRVKSASELEEDEAELKEALEEMVSLGKKGKKQIDEKDAFLLDYISQKKWKGEKLEEVDHDSDEDDNDNGDVDLDDDEEELDKTDAFESKYNFRFEELQGGENESSSSGNARDASGGILSGIRSSGLSAIQVTGHARNVEGSLRRVDDKRKQQRESRKELKEKERRQKEAELRRLKNLKKQELQDRLRKISEVGGLKDLGLDESVLDEDWDPEKYEAMMQKQYGDGYYGEVDDGFDVTNPLAGLEDIDGDDDGEGYGDDGKEEGWYDDGGEVEVQEGGDEKVEGGKKSKKDKKKNKKDKKGNKNNSEEDVEETYGEDGEQGGEGGQASSSSMTSMMDELYKLDYEDIVAGIPCRFKYRQVKPESFGLTAEEILQADDNDLNSFVSLKKLSAYVPSENLDEFKVSKKRKRLRATLRERLEKDKEEECEAEKEVDKKVAEGDAEDVKKAAEGEVADEEVSGKKKRRRRKKKSGNNDEDDDNADNGSDVEDGDAAGEKKPVVAVSKKAVVANKVKTANKKVAELANVKDRGGPVPSFVKSVEKQKEKEKKRENIEKKNKTKKEKTPEELAAEAKKRRMNLYD